MKKTRRCGLLIALLALTLSCKKEDRTTVVFGTVKNDINQPIEGVDVELYGVKGAFAAQLTFLKTTQTDAKGEYSITTEISKEYHSGDLDFVSNGKILDKYSNLGSKLYFNGNQTKDCCRVSISQKNQYDLVLVRK